MYLKLLYEVLISKFEFSVQRIDKNREWEKTENWSSTRELFMSW